TQETGDQCRWTANRQFSSQFLQTENIAQRHPAMRNITKNANAQPLEAVESLANRIRIEEGLSRVLVRSIPGIDDIGVDVPGQKRRRTRNRMPYHNHIDL